MHLCIKNLGKIETADIEINAITIIAGENNEKKNQSRNAIKGHYSHKAEENHIQFGLERFKRLYFKNVYTVTEDEFENNFVMNWEQKAF
ncbi:MAG: hypothetical protein FWF87_06775 [Synergistaceae bacterium]|nr:hypothetical protein [Synergistaceae bacterium]